MRSMLEQLGRRGFLGGVGAAAAGAALGGAGGVGTEPDGTRPGAHRLDGLTGTGAGAADANGAAASGSGAGTGAVSTSIGALERAGVQPGAVFGTCAVTDVAAKDDGAVAVSLRDTAGGRFELELLGHEPHTPGVARAGSLAVYLNNQGRGVTATVEEHGLAAMALGAHLGRREADGVVLPALPTLSQRAV